MSTAFFAQLQTTLGTAYRLERELGGGGMSRVFLAHDIALERKVVVKVLLPELAASVSVERFRREIQLAAQLQHPHIVPLLAAGESAGLPYFTMPFITGESLRVKLAREGELPVTEAVRMLRDIVSALVCAHGLGVVHRDIKPDNVLISGGVAVVTDFGVAKAVSASAQTPITTSLTSAGVALGTPAYMAPEQAAGDGQVDHRADLYALGAMAYEMLTGQPPFAGRSPQAVLAAHVIETPEAVDRRRPAVPPMLATLVMACLAKHPADRPQSAADVLHVLDAIGTPTAGTASTKATRVTGSVGSRRMSRNVVVALAGAVAAISGMLWWRSMVPSTAPSTMSEPPQAAIVRTGDSAVATEEKGNSARESVGPAPPDLRPAEPTRPKPRRNVPTPPIAPMIESESIARLPPAASDSMQSRSPPITPSESIAAGPSRSAVVAPTPVSPPVPPPVSQPVDPARPPVTDPRLEIRQTVADYASAIESRDVGNIRRLYPGITPVQQQGWEQFFELVRDVKAQLAVTQFDVSDGTADAQITGTYTYLNNSTRRIEQQSVSFRATLRRDGTGWRISQIR